MHADQPDLNAEMLVRLTAVHNGLATASGRKSKAKTTSKKVKVIAVADETTVTAHPLEPVPSRSPVQMLQQSDTLLDSLDVSGSTSAAAPSGQSIPFFYQDHIGSSKEICPDDVLPFASSGQTACLRSPSAAIDPVLLPSFDAAQQQKDGASPKQRDVTHGSPTQASMPKETEQDPVRLIQSGACASHSVLSRRYTPCSAVRHQSESPGLPMHQHKRQPMPESSQSSQVEASTGLIERPPKKRKVSTKNKTDESSDAKSKVIKAGRACDL